MAYALREFFAEDAVPGERMRLRRDALCSARLTVTVVHVVHGAVRVDVVQVLQKAELGLFPKPYTNSSLKKGLLPQSPGELQIDSICLSKRDPEHETLFPLPKVRARQEEKATKPLETRLRKRANSKFNSRVWVKIHLRKRGDAEGEPALVRAGAQARRPTERA